jgi:hypothetical protein
MVAESGTAYHLVKDASSVLNDTDAENDTLTALVSGLVTEL